MKVMCRRCDARPYSTKAGWVNHLVCHREADLLDVAAGGVKALESLKPYIRNMEQQEAEQVYVVEGT